VSYFRPPKARKTGPWSITRLSNSTQKMSQKGGRVMAQSDDFILWARFGGRPEALI
jgi:hypothetical protein